MVESEEHNGEVDYMYSHSFSNCQEIEPSTLLKVPHDNEVIKKVIAYQKLGNRTQSDTSNKNESSVSAHANPELFITERDLLVTLVENKMAPEQAEQICKSLFNESNDPSLLHVVKKFYFRKPLHIKMLIIIEETISFLKNILHKNYFIVVNYLIAPIAQYLP